MLDINHDIRHCLHRSDSPTQQIMASYRWHCFHMLATSASCNHSASRIAPPKSRDDVTSLARLCTVTWPFKLPYKYHLCSPPPYPPQVPAKHPRKESLNHVEPRSQCDNTRRPAHPRRRCDPAPVLARVKTDGCQTAYRALQNPKLFNSKLYKQAGYAIAAGFAIRLVVAIPALLVRIFLFFLSFVVDFRDSQLDSRTLSTLTFVEKSVLQLPFFLMCLMRFVSPAMDDMFMRSLEWVDKTYIAKHKDEDPATLRKLYYHNFRSTPREASRAPSLKRNRRTEPSLHFYSVTAAAEPGPTDLFRE